MTDTTWNPWKLIRVIQDLHEKLDRIKAERDAYRGWHWKRCQCHDSWDQCNCASDGHPEALDCACCDLGTGLCDPKPGSFRAVARGDRR